MWRKVTIAALSAAFLFGMTACDNTSPDNPAQESENISVQDSSVDDDTGTYGPYMRPDGTLRNGIDMGGGLQYNMEKGTIEFGFGF